MNRTITDAGVAGLPLAEGRNELLEEIMATTALETVPPTGAPEPPRRARWLPVLGAAAAVAVAAACGVWLSGQAPDDVRQPRDLAVGSAPGAGEIAVLTAPGWTLESGSVDAEYGGELSYSADDQSIDATPNDGWGVTLDINWRPSDSYESYVEDRQDLGPSEEVVLLGETSRMWRYGRADHTVIRPVVGDFTLEVRGSGMAQAAFRDLLGQLTAIAPADLDDHLPEDFVTGDERAAVIAEMLGPIPAPAAFDPASVQSVEIDRYQLGAEVTGAVACAWLDQYRAARADGDDAARREAQDAMATAREWPVLREMEERGDWPDAIYDISDHMAAGDRPTDWTAGIGCEG